MSDKNKREVNNNKTNAKKEVFEWIFSIAIGVIIAVLINRFVLINARVPSASMENNIMTGDRLFGYRLAYVNEEVERGDIVIFKFPDDESQLFIKRVIGLPNETVTIIDGKVYIDDNKEPLMSHILRRKWLVLLDRMRCRKIAISCLVTTGTTQEIQDSGKIHM